MVYRRLLSHAVATALATCTVSAYAQESDSADSSIEPIELVTVTGSRIRGVAPTGSNVLSLDRLDITQTASLSVPDILKELPQVVGVGVSEATHATTTGSGSNNLTRGTAVNLRGLGPNATLVLFDGYRVTESGVAATYVDTSVFPTIALERFEVVADGASAIYGSDAIGGVVNLILRKNFQGAETDIRHVSSDGYSRWQVSQLLGHRWQSGGIVAAYEFTDNDSLFSSERDWHSQDQRDRGGVDYRVSNCAPGNVVLDGVSYAIPAGGAVTPADLVPNTRNVCDMGFATLIPEQRRHNATLRLEQDLGDRVTLNATGFYSSRDFRAGFADQGSSLATTATLTVPETNAFFVAPTGTNPSSLTVQHSFLPARGPVFAEGDLETYGAFMTLDISLPNSWRAELSGSHSENSGSIFSHNINSQALNAALASSDVDTALDVFGTRTNPAVYDAIYSGIFIPFGENLLQTAALRLDGPLFELPGGTVRIAAGAEYFYSSITRGNHRGTLNAPRTTQYGGSRDTQSAYAEIIVPLIGDGNAAPGIEQLHFSAAVRHDKYSDFGDTTNPKFGLTWEPIEGVQVRTSYGTSFRAPLLTEMQVNDPRIQVVNAVDPLSPTGRTMGLSLRGNPWNLGPEEATMWSAGLQLSPASFAGWGLNLNYFRVAYEGQIFAVEGTDALMQENIYADLIIRNPTDAQIAEVLNLGLPVQGVMPPTIGFIVDARPYNRGKTEQAGMDFQVSYDWSVDGIGDFRASAIGMYLQKYDYQVTSLAPSVDRLNTIINPLRFRGRGGVDWSKGAWRAGAWLNYVNSYDNNQVDPVQRVDAWTTFDLRVGYVSSGDGGWSDGLELSVNISNLTDEDPPYVNTPVAYDPEHAHALGRAISLGVTKRW